MIVPSAHPRRDALVALLRGYEGNPVLERLERNRLLNWIEVLMLIHREKSVVASRDAIAAHRDAVQADRDAVARERDVAAAARDDLAERLASVQATLRELEERHRALEARWYTRAGTWVGERLDRRRRT
jgi:hypothetical protein